MRVKITLFFLVVCFVLFFNFITTLCLSTASNGLSLDLGKVHQTLSAKRTGSMFDVCQRLVPSRAVSVYTVYRIAFRSATKTYPVYIV